MLQRVLNRVMRRERRLDEHPPPPLPPPRPPGDLREQVERLLRGSKIGISKDRVGAQDGGERDVGEMMSLAEHLRADQGLRLSAAKALQDAHQRSLASRGLAIEHVGGDVREIAPEA